MANTYSVPRQANRVFTDGILGNPRLAHNVPAGASEIAARSIRFKGADRPSIPINWRFAESVSALKAYEAAVLALLVKKKYGTEVGEIVIDTDHACLFFMSPLIAQLVGGDGKPTPFNPLSATSQELIPNADKHDSWDPYRGLATNIYRTNDGRYYHVHGSMNPDPTLTALGLPLRDPVLGADPAAAKARIQAAVVEHTADELDLLMNETYRQAGCIAYSVEEYACSEAGRANHAAGLYEITKVDEGELPAAWWPEHASKPPSARRPLAGLKVVDLTRVIAGPSISRSLAELGASVMRVTSPKLADLSGVHHDLNWGKWNAYLDLTDEADKKRLWALIKDADVVVNGYRPGAMERKGFGRDAVFEAVKGRGRGIVYAREDCYGWHGPWRHRSGWQQISDVCCGISFGYGRAMGLDEPVTPVFPNSDFCTGIQGCVGVLHALIRRAEEGGSYGVDTALNYYSTWLAESVGEYPRDVWDELWTRHERPVFRHDDNMRVLMPAMIKLLYQHDAAVIFNPSFFETRTSGALGNAQFVFPKPVAQFMAGTVDLRYDVGTRGNGVDDAVWPDDLTVEVVKKTGDRSDIV